MSCKTMLDSSSSGHLTAEKHWMQQKQLKKKSITFISATNELPKLLYIMLNSIMERSWTRIWDVDNLGAVRWHDFAWTKGIHSLYVHELQSLVPGFALHTCAEGDGVDERAGNLLSCSLVPQRKVICVKHALLVLRCQEVSEESHRVTLNRFIRHSDSGASDQRWR